MILGGEIALIVDERVDFNRPMYSDDDITDIRTSQIVSLPQQQAKCARIQAGITGVTLRRRYTMSKALSSLRNSPDQLLQKIIRCNRRTHARHSKPRWEHLQHDTLCSQVP
jgi:hypothetical protein